MSASFLMTLSRAGFLTLASGNITFGFKSRHGSFQKCFLKHNVTEITKTWFLVDLAAFGVLITPKIFQRKFKINCILRKIWQKFTSAAAAKLLQSCPTLCDPIDDSPPGSAVPGILQARTLEWVAISFSNA